MKSKKIIPPNLGWIQSQLDQEHLDFLWESIKKSSKKDHKSKLAGNISRSFELKDEEDYFFNEILFPHSQVYYNTYGGHPIREHAYGELELTLEGFWANYQYQGEFNPYHHHGGVYSFAIWMKIPTNWKEQSKLPFLDGMKEEDKKASIFEFEYTDMLGDIRNFGYRLDKSLEGTMLFFPAALRHTVYPFYKCDEPRISIAGNLWYKSM